MSMYQRVAVPRKRLEKGGFIQRGFSLIELMVGMTIGFIALIVIVQTMSVFETHKTTTTAAADAQENGLLALSAIERDIRRAGAGFNDPMVMKCQVFYSYLQTRSGQGMPAPVGAAAPFPVIVEDGAINDRITVKVASYLEGVVPTPLAENMAIIPLTPPILLPAPPVPAEYLQFVVNRGFEMRGEPRPNTDDPPADLIMVVNKEAVADIPAGNNLIRCSLMQVSAVAVDAMGRSVITVQNGPAGKEPEFNAPHNFMAANDWPGFGRRAPPLPSYAVGDLLFRLGSTALGGVMQTTYEINGDSGLQAVVSGGRAAVATEILASDVVALQAQYGLSATPQSREITQWVNPSGPTWGSAALNPQGVNNVPSAVIDNRMRIKAVRIAVVARSGKREGNVVTTPCAENNVPAASNHGPCSWTDDSAASPAPAIDLRTAPGDTEWQHYRYRVYQTVIPMRNLLWPSL